MSQSLMQSFRNASCGVVAALRERNFRIQCIVGGAAVFAAFSFPLPRSERLVILLLTALVLVLELLNSSIEGILNILHPEHSEIVREAKDKAAAAVLISSLTAIIIGLMIFVPHILRFLQ